MQPKAQPGGLSPSPLAGASPSPLAQSGGAVTPGALMLRILLPDRIAPGGAASTKVMKFDKSNTVQQVLTEVFAKMRAEWYDVDIFSQLDGGIYFDRNQLIGSYITANMRSIELQVKPPTVAYTPPSPTLQQRLDTFEPGQGTGGLDSFESAPPPQQQASGAPLHQSGEKKAGFAFGKGKQLNLDGQGLNAMPPSQQDTYEVINLSNNQVLKSVC